MKVVATQNGDILVVDKEKPVPAKGHVLIRTEYSAMSPGTEMIFVKKASDRVVNLGYSAVGIVEQVGDEVANIQVGQRVACYGAPYVHHGQWLSVPANLSAVVPDHVDPKEAAFAGLGAIAIHALRIADLRFGESAIVVGLGILGNIIAQVSNAASYRTVGTDINSERVEMLKKQGIIHAFDNLSALEEQLSEAVGPFGADAVLHCASGPGEELINRSFQWLRDRGKIVIVGDLSTEYSRAMMFGKEAQVLISRAGGPGRYDAKYELHNQDYPIGYVRWTEGRNVAEYIRLLAEGKVSIKSLITDVYPIDEVSKAYDSYRNYSPESKTIGTLIQFS